MALLHTLPVAFLIVTVSVTESIIFPQDNEIRRNLVDPDEVTKTRPVEKPFDRKLQARTLSLFSQSGEEDEDEKETSETLDHIVSLLGGKNKVEEVENKYKAVVPDIPLSSHPLWRVHKYQGIDIRPVPLPPIGTYGPPVQTYGPPIETYGPPEPEQPIEIYGSPLVQTYGPPVSKHPTETYGPPVETYGPPVETYGPPVETYGPPVKIYGPPVETYGPPVSKQPTETYGPPVETYGPPVSKHPTETYIPPVQTYGPPAQIYGTPEPRQPIETNSPILDTYGAPGTSSGEAEALTAIDNLSGLLSLLPGRDSSVSSNLLSSLGNSPVGSSDTSGLSIENLSLFSNLLSNTHTPANTYGPPQTQNQNLALPTVESLLNKLKSESKPSVSIFALKNILSKRPDLLRKLLTALTVLKTSSSSLVKGVLPRSVGETIKNITLFYRNNFQNSAIFNNLNSNLISTTQTAPDIYQEGIPSHYLFLPEETANLKALEGVGKLINVIKLIIHEGHKLVIFSMPEILKDDAITKLGAAEKLGILCKAPKSFFVLNKVQKLGKNIDKSILHKVKVHVVTAPIKLKGKLISKLVQLAKLKYSIITIPAKVVLIAKTLGIKIHVLAKLLKLAKLVILKGKIIGGIKLLKDLKYAIVTAPLKVKSHIFSKIKKIHNGIKLIKNHIPSKVDLLASTFKLDAKGEKHVVLDTAVFINELIKSNVINTTLKLQLIKKLLDSCNLKSSEKANFLKQISNLFLGSAPVTEVPNLLKLPDLPSIQLPSNYKFHETGTGSPYVVKFRSSPVTYIPPVNTYAHTPNTYGPQTPYYHSSTSGQDAVSPTYAKVPQFSQSLLVQEPRQSVIQSTNNNLYTSSQSAGSNFKYQVPHSSPVLPTNTFVQSSETSSNSPVHFSVPADSSSSAYENSFGSSIQVPANSQVTTNTQPHVTTTLGVLQDQSVFYSPQTQGQQSNVQVTNFNINESRIPLNSYGQQTLSYTEIPSELTQVNFEKNSQNQFSNTGNLNASSRALPSGQIASDPGTIMTDFGSFQSAEIVPFQATSRSDADIYPDDQNPTESDHFQPSNLAAATGAGYSKVVVQRPKQDDSHKEVTNQNTDVKNLTDVSNVSTLIEGKMSESTDGILTVSSQESNHQIDFKPSPTDSSNEQRE